MYLDLTKRDNKTAPNVDIYVAGFPCQPFSSAGLQQGFKDKRGRGKIFFHVLDYLSKQKPRVFILENVKGLTTLEKGTYMKAILKELNKLGCYNIQWQVLDTKQHGVPHSRRRWYCVGIHKDFDDGSFEFPKPIRCPDIESFLEERDARLAATGLPPASQTVALKNVRDALREKKGAGFDPRKEAFVVDCDSSAERSKAPHGICPCITVGRGGGHWVTNRGRRTSKEEMMRLQGMNPTTFKVAVTEAQLGKQLGNTMSVNVLERLLCKVLPAAKLVRHGELTDRWANGSAVRLLKATRGKGFMETPAETGTRKRKRESEPSVENLPHWVLNRLPIESCVEKSKTLAETSPSKRRCQAPGTDAPHWVADRMPRFD
jgi:DNA (cytosine-5)-methyltransferase 1